MRRMLLIRSAISLILIAIVLFGVGIFLTLELGIFLEPEQSILTDRPCAPPCWYGIIPGETQKDAAWNALKQNPYVMQRTLEELHNGDAAEFIWFNRHGTRLSWLYLRGNVVQMIRVEAESSIKFGDIFSRFGSPERVLAWYSVTPEDVSQGYGVRLYYPRRGIAISTQTAPITSDGQSPINATMAATEITYFKPTSLEGLFDLERSFTDDITWSTDAQDRLQNWNGFGLYYFPLAPL